MSEVSAPREVTHSGLSEASLLVKQLPDYNQHEAQYCLLRQRGFNGWGGESLEQRMAGWQATLDRLFHSGLFPSSGSVLELGSGAGDSMIPLAERGYCVTGVEISPTDVEWAREKFADRKLQGRFVLGNIAESLPFASSSFDVVLDAACLHCIVGVDRVTALREVNRVLRSQGFLLISHMVNDPRSPSAELRFDSARRVLTREGVPYRSIPRLECLIEEVEEAGFQIVEQSVRDNPWWDHAELWCRKIDGTGKQAG